MPYTKQNWENDEEGGTPITASALDHIETGIDDATDLAELTATQMPLQIAAALEDANEYTDSQIPLITTPDEISGLAGWWRPEELAGMADGDSLTTWNDASGNNRHLTQATSGKRPVVKDKAILFGGRRCVRFAGTDDTLAKTDVTGLATLTGFTSVIVAKINLVTGNHEAMHFDNGAGITMMRNKWESSSWQCEVGGTTTLAVDTYRGAGIRMFTWSGSDVAHFAGKSCTSDAAIGAFSPTVTRIFMGSYRDSSNWFTGDIAESIIYNKALSNSEREGLVHHLAQKYGLAVATV